MKHNLGKTLTLLLLFFLVMLKAEDFNYSFHIDKPRPYVKEPVILTLELNQTNPNIVLLFNFDLEKSKNYTFQRIDSKETDTQETQGLHNAHVTYTYLIYPLTSGEVILSFKLLKKVTSDESVAYSYSGDRDNVKTLVTTDTPITLPSLKLNARPLPKGTQIVGDFTLDYRIKKYEAKAYEPLPYEVTLKGLGYPPLLTLIPKDVNFTVFQEKPLRTTHSDVYGTHNRVVYPMALSHDKDFLLPELTLNAFDPKTQRSYSLNIPEQKFNITQVDKSQLVDKKDNPKALSMDWDWLVSLLSYLLVFIAGYLTAMSWKWAKITKAPAAHPLKEKIQNAKNHKALLQILMAHDPHRFHVPIKALEDSLYGHGKMNLSKVKKEVIDLL